MSIARRVPANVLTNIRKSAQVPGLAVHEIGKMTDLQEVILLAQVLRHAVSAYQEQVTHMVDVEADPSICQKCADYFAWPFDQQPCGAYAWWQQQADAAWRVS